jgi:hypothetical protein
MTTSPVSFPRSYWVVPGKLLAGFYPGAKDPKEATVKVTALINAGIRHVINLMEPDERDFTGQLLFDKITFTRISTFVEAQKARSAKGFPGFALNQWLSRNQYISKRQG